MCIRDRDYPVTAVKTGIENWLFSDLHLFILFLFPAYFLGYVLQYIFTLKWYMTGKKRISSGKPVRYGLRIGYRIWNGFVNIALAVLIVWVYYLGLHKIAVIALIAVLFFVGLQAAENYFRPKRKNGRKIRRIGWGSYIAVSYTHLDVYKRQDRYRSDFFRICRRRRAVYAGTGAGERV